MGRFLIAFLATAVLVLTGVALINYRIDPYQLYHLDPRDSERLSRIAQFNHMRYYKPLHASQLKPAALVIGTSRSGAMHPVHTAWEGKVGYNFATNGATLHEMRRYIEHVHALGELDYLTIGLDFEAFMKPEPESRPGFKDQRLLGSDTPLWRYWLNRFRDHQVALLSFSSLQDSNKVRLGESGTVTVFYGNGTWVRGRNKLWGRGAFGFESGRLRDMIAAGGFDDQANLEKFADLLAFCHIEGIAVRLFFTPIHMAQLDLWFSAGFEDRWQRFHEQVAAINARVASEQGAIAFPLYGFKNEPAWVAHPIHSGRRAHREASPDGIHYMADTSAQILDQLWGADGGLGWAITVESLPAYFAEVADLRARFVAENAELLQELRGSESGKKHRAKLKAAK